MLTSNQMKNQELVRQARAALSQGRRDIAKSTALKLTKIKSTKAEGFFILALVSKQVKDIRNTASYLENSLKADRGRYDAAIELSEIFLRSNQHNKAADLVRKYVPKIGEDAFYLNKAGDLLGRLGLHGEAWSCFALAVKARPDAKSYRMNLALCATKVGQLELAEKHMEDLLAEMPDHQRIHFELSKARKAKDDKHSNQIKSVLEQKNSADENNVFLHFALGKTLEDQGRWAEAFGQYKRGNDAAWRIGQNQGYEVQSEIAVLEALAEKFKGASSHSPAVIETKACPIFIVGLPRSGTTLLEKIITGHTDIESIDETFFLEQAVKRQSKLPMQALLTRDAIENLADDLTGSVIQAYVDKTAYLRIDRKFFIEKYPFNFLYLGVIARHLPAAKVLYVRRDPMDVCYAMYKQPYFKFSFSLEDLGRYYLAYRKLESHWLRVLGHRIEFVNYERLVNNSEETVHRIMAYLGLKYSSDLLEFHKRQDVSASASSAQIREKLYSTSIGKWKNVAKELEPLSQILESKRIRL